MSYEAIIYTKEQGIATLTFNRPQVMNAGNFQLYAEMRAAVEEANNDDEVKILIVTGAGRGFHAGDDVKSIFLAEDIRERQKKSRIAQMKGSAITRPIVLPINFYKPSIAAVNGPAVGLGFEISLSCDIRIASENAKFGYFYVKRGIAGGYSAMMLLPMIVGLPRALEMMYSGELIDATEAEKIGLVRKVVPQDKLMEEAKKLASKLMEGAPLAQQVIKQGVYRAMFDPATLVDFAERIGFWLWQTEDHLEGAKAFTEKRKAQYKGR